MAGSILKAKITVNEEALRRIKERLAGAAKKVHQHRLSVGIHEADSHEEAKGYDGKPTGIDVVTEAMIHEFGAHGTPERSWLRSWYAEAVKDLAEKWGKELHDWITTGAASLAPLSSATEAERTKHGLSAGPPLYATGQLVKVIRAMLDAQFVD